MSSWQWLGGRKLDEVITKSLTHLELVIETVKKLNQLIDSIATEKISILKDIYNQVVDYERKADSIKRDILESLRGAFIHPLDREDLLRLILTADDIAAYCKASARQLVTFYDIGMNIPENILDILVKISKKTVEAGEKLLESIKCLGTNPNKTISLTHEIEKIEEEIDELRMEALEHTYRICLNNFRLDCILLINIIDNLEAISDKIEDTSDVIRLIALSS